MARGFAATRWPSVDLQVAYPGIEVEPAAVDGGIADGAQNGKCLREQDGRILILPNDRRRQGNQDTFFGMEVMDQLCSSSS